MRRTNSRVFVAVVIIMLALTACGGSSAKSKYDSDLKSGMEKYYSGQKMNADEYNAVKNFQNWKNKNSEHTYNDWNK